MIRHIAMIRLAHTTTASDLDKIDAGLGTLPALIDEIEAYRFGRDIGHTDGSWDYAVVGDFASLQAYDIYASHPDHVRVIADFIAPHLIEIARTQYEF